MKTKLTWTGDFSSFNELEAKLKTFFSTNPAPYFLEATHSRILENAPEKEATSFIKRQIESLLKPGSLEHELVITIKNKKGDETSRALLEIGFYFNPKKNSAETWVKTAK
ncbi:MAG: hypothetical protein PHD95_00295 [Candidatus ainarchaeum sp.]|nr:hypothetical protein [Candidatus ainarchaeum sp.]